VSPLRVATDPRRVHGKQAIKDFTLKYPDEAPTQELVRINTICLVQMDIFVVESLKNAPEVRCAAAVGLLRNEGHSARLSHLPPLLLIAAGDRHQQVHGAAGGDGHSGGAVPGDGGLLPHL
jgi:hypothetical protein